MTTPANLLRDTDAPLIASVCNIPCTGTRTTTTSTIPRSHRASSRQINNVRGDDGDWRTEDAEPSGSRGIANGISRGGNGDSNDITSDDGDLSSSSSSSSSSSPLSSPSHLHPHSILNDEEIARRKRIYSRARLNLLDKLFRDVDMLIYLELGVLYYME
ncbi:hypothetical protein AAP_04385 [Ascosphaera apis ARSEF 7405]|uniref:Uncharacterized protein n=1 Tax=Ascosphaera apis ARSEF 7405 TaxID=392613 RepID=A0A167WT50_9EURO|nr:hypothetical protein AAP_04385 [Ascosphaera apis ARSEF 7405]